MLVLQHVGLIIVIKENNSDIVPDYEIQSLYELVNLVEE